MANAPGIARASLTSTPSIITSSFEPQSRLLFSNRNSYYEFLMMQKATSAAMVAEWLHSAYVVLGGTQKWSPQESRKVLSAMRASSDPT